VREITEREKAGYLLDRELASIVNGIPESTLGLFCPALQGRGVTLIDRSAYANNGAISGATWKRLPSGLWVLNFNGTADKVTVTHAASIKPTAGLTVIAWFRTTDYTETQGIADVIDDTTGYCLILYGSALLSTLRVTGCAGLTKAGSTAWNNVWKCAGMTFGAIGGHILYLNGANVASDSDSGSITQNTRNLTLGNRAFYSPTTAALRGDLALPVIVGREYSATEMLRFFTRYRLLFGV